MHAVVKVGRSSASDHSECLLHAAASLSTHGSHRIVSTDPVSGHLIDCSMIVSLEVASQAAAGTDVMCEESSPVSKYRPAAERASIGSPTATVPLNVALGATQRTTPRSESTTAHRCRVSSVNRMALA